MLSQVQRLLLSLSPVAALTSATSAEWGSATFTGHRHQLCFSFPTQEAADDFEAAIKDNHSGCELPSCSVVEMSIVETDGLFITVEVVTLNN